MFDSYVVEKNKDKLDGFQKADQFLFRVIVLQWILVSTFGGVFYDLYIFGFLVGGLVTLLSYVSYKLYSGTPVLRILNAIILMNFSIILIQQSLGRIEMHFHIFVMLAILVIYKDIKPLALAAFYIVVHHILFTYLQLQNVNIFDLDIVIFNYGCGYDIAFLHAFFVVLELAVLIKLISINIATHNKMLDDKEKIHTVNEKLEEQQQQFTSMVSNVPGAIYRAVDDSEWPIIYLSDEIEKMTGYPASDFISGKIKTFALIMHHDDLVPIGQKIQEQFAKDKGFQVDYRVIAKNGDIKWVRSQGQSVKTDSGEAFIDGVLIDITKAKEAEARIELLSELVYGSLKSAEVGVWWVDFTEEDTFHALENTATMIGIDFKAEGSDALSIIEWGEVLLKTGELSDEYQKAAEKTYESYTGAISGKYESFHAIYPIADSSNNVKWVEARADVPKRDKDGKALLMTGTLIDITEQKRNELEILNNQRQLQRSEERLKISTESAGIATWEWIIAEDKTIASDKYQEVFGFDPAEEKVSKVWAERLHPDDKDETYQALTDHLEGKTQEYYSEFRYRHPKDEQYVWLSGAGKIVEYNEDGSPKILMGINQDISERKNAELLLKEQQEQFESMVSNTPGVIYRINESDRSIVFMSEQISQLTGYPVSYFDSEDKYYNLINPDDLEKIISIAKQEKHAGDHTAVEYRITHKGGSTKWVRNQRNVIENENGELLNDGTIFDITDVIDAQEKIEESRLFLNTLLDSQEQIIITTDGETITSANETFLDFFAIHDIEDFTILYGADCICETFNTKAREGYLQIEMDNETWIDYVIARSSQTITHKAMITRGEIDFIFSVTAANLPGNEGLKSAVFTNITEMEKTKQEVETIHKHTRESIEYASLIQGALIPDNQTIAKYFADFFTLWQPKDVIGGDIYLFEELRGGDESLMMVIDCTGHGVPGAFVTMLVKAMERQIISKIENDINIDVSPAWILGYLNRTMKKLLQQESEESISNAGFDGGIIYYNKKESIMKFAGAETPLFYIEDSELKTIKGNRHSIGYKKSDASYKFKEHIIPVKEGMKFYLTTDGYIDQNGGEKGFPMGKKQFTKLIVENQDETFTDQEELLLHHLKNYQGDEERNDDITVVGFEIKEQATVKTILEYNGVLTQGIIAHSMDVLENSIDDMNIIGKISTVVIELTQNMMHYSKSKDINSREIVPAGLIEVTQDSESTYYVKSENIVSIEDKIRMETKLTELKSLNQIEIKKRYRELRKSGAHSHEKGGGIGFYEIAKLTQEFEYSFTEINAEKFIYEFKAIVSTKKRHKETSDEEEK